MIDLSRVRYIISDWDGTLVDSMPHYAQAFSRLMSEKFGVDDKTVVPYYLSTAGTALTDQIKEAAQKFANRKIEDTLELENLFWSYIKDSSAPQIITGARETLESLKAKGDTFIVWSGTRTDILAVKLEQTGLGQFVDFYIGNTPGSETQVKGPALFAGIAKHFGLSTDDLRSQSVVIGDGAGDMEAGKTVNCPTVGILKTQTENALKSAGADFVIASIKDLPSLLIQ